jgi:hypothetical protein
MHALGLALVRIYWMEYSKTIIKLNQPVKLARVQLIGNFTSPSWQVGSHILIE